MQSKVFTAYLALVQDVEAPVKTNGVDSQFALSQNLKACDEVDKRLLALDSWLLIWAQECPNIDAAEMIRGHISVIKACLNKDIVVDLECHVKPLIRALYVAKTELQPECFIASLTAAVEANARDMQTSIAQLEAALDEADYTTSECLNTKHKIRLHDLNISVSQTMREIVGIRSVVQVVRSTLASVQNKEPPGMADVDPCREAAKQLHALIADSEFHVYV